MKTFCMKCQIQFSWKNVINLSSAELAHRAVKVIHITCNRLMCLLSRFWVYCKLYHNNFIVKCNRQFDVMLDLLTLCTKKDATPHLF